MTPHPPTATIRPRWKAHAEPQRVWSRSVFATSTVSTASPVGSDLRADRTLSWNALRRYAYDACGNLLSEECSVPALASNRYRFQGREWSAATGLTNFRARWYDPETGRWLSKDPIGLAGGLNLYAFCGNEPVNNTDTDGLSVTNHSDVLLYIKPEHSFTDECGNTYRTDSAYPLPPGEIWPYGQDGISVPAFHPFEVYKVQGKGYIQAQLVVEKDGSVIHMDSYHLSGEWKGLDWLQSLHDRIITIIDDHDLGPGGPQLLPTISEEPRPDHTWDNLFRTSNPEKYRDGKLILDLP